MRFIASFLLLTSVARAAFFDSASDWEAVNWLANNKTNGNALSAKAYLTGVRFMNQVKQWAIRPYLGRVNLYVGDNTNAMQVPIIVDWRSSYTNDDLVAFAASDYSETNGLTGNTSTKYLRCCGSAGLNLATFTGGANLHFADYCRTASNEASDESGVGNATGTWGLVHGNGGNTYIFMGANVNSAADSMGSGFYLTSRIETNLAYTYRGTTELKRDTATDTGSAGSPAGLQMVWHAININGVVLANTSRTLSYHAMGFAVPTNAISRYKIAVENAQTPFGRKL